MGIQLTSLEISRRKQHLSFAIANNELSSYVISEAEKLDLERYVLGEVTLPEILAKWKDEDKALIEKLQSIAATEKDSTCTRIG